MSQSTSMLEAIKIASNAQTSLINDNGVSSGDLHRNILGLIRGIQHLNSGISQRPNQHLSDITMSLLCVISGIYKWYIRPHHWHIRHLSRYIHPHLLNGIWGLIMGILGLHPNASSLSRGIRDPIRGIYQASSVVFRHHYEHIRSSI